MGRNKGVVGTLCGAVNKLGITPGRALIDETYLQRGADRSVFLRKSRQYIQKGCKEV